AGDDYSWIVDSLDYMTNRVYRGAEYIINQGVPPGYPDRELVGFLYGLVAAETDQARLINGRISEFIRDSLDRIDLNDDLKARQFYLEYRLWEIDRLIRRADQATVKAAAERLRDWGKQIDDPHTCLAVGQFFRARGFTDEALLWVDVAFDARPDSYARRDINIGLASIRRQRGEIALAMTAVEAALKIDPDSPAALYNFNLLKADAALQRQDYPEALEAFQRLTWLDPESPLPLFNLGVIYDRMPGEQEKALQAYSIFLMKGGGAQYPEAAQRARQRIEVLTAEMKRP
ncbi:MAG: tetratricopeptide repeat protein, partial [candidate division Zixibacteria bacterium]|nr:tetratricopeptide repeat protein [candidate division Zixibacteria bacterium]